MPRDDLAAAQRSYQRRLLGGDSTAGPQLLKTFIGLGFSEAGKFIAKCRWNKARKRWLLLEDLASEARILLAQKLSDLARARNVRQYAIKLMHRAFQLWCDKCAIIEVKQTTLKTRRAMAKKSGEPVSLPVVHFSHFLESKKAAPNWVEAYADLLAGLLACCLSDRERDYLRLFIDHVESTGENPTDAAAGAILGVTGMAVCKLRHKLWQRYAEWLNSECPEEYLESLSTQVYKPRRSGLYLFLERLAEYAAAAGEAMAEVNAEIAAKLAKAEELEPRLSYYDCLSDRNKATGVKLQRWYYLDGRDDYKPKAYYTAVPVPASTGLDSVLASATSIDSAIAAPGRTVPAKAVTEAAAGSKIQHDFAQAP